MNAPIPAGPASEPADGPGTSNETAVPAPPAARSGNDAGGRADDVEGDDSATDSRGSAVADDGEGGAAPAEPPKRGAYYPL